MFTRLLHCLAFCCAVLALVGAAIVLLASFDNSAASASSPPTNTGQAAPQQRWWERPDKGVYKARLEPHWLGESPRFWYRNRLQGDTSE